MGVSKPDPKGIFDAMKHFGIDNPRDVIVIGDSYPDIEAARRLIYLFILLIIVLILTIHKYFQN